MIEINRTIDGMKIEEFTSFYKTASTLDLEMIFDEIEKWSKTSDEIAGIQEELGDLEFYAEKTTGGHTHSGCSILFKVAGDGWSNVVFKISDHKKYTNRLFGKIDAKTITEDLNNYVAI